MTTVKIKFIPSSGGGNLKYTKEEPTITFFYFMEDVIAGLRVIGRTRTSETYQTTLNSFKRFRNYIDLPLDHFDSHIVLAYEAYLKSCRVSLNSSSFYMRNLRAMYNRAVDTGFTQQRFPFKHVYTGVDKTHKRALKIIGKKLGIRTPLTMYVSRHSWASIAKSKNVPLSVISEGMGHDSEATTRIYLASLNTVAIDKANTLIINSL